MLQPKPQITPALLHQLTHLLSLPHPHPLSKKQLTFLTTLTCQNINLLNYSNFDTQSLHKDCLDIIQELHVIECEKSEEAGKMVIGCYLKHQIEHPGCHVSLGVLWRVLGRSAKGREVMRGEYLEGVVGLVEGIWQRLEEGGNGGKFKLLERRKVEVTKESIIQRAINEMSSLPKPTRRQQRQRTEIPGKVPPLVVPTIHTITSSRFDLPQSPTTTGATTALQEFQKLASSLGEATVGVELGILMNKRRSTQVELFQKSQEYRRSLEEGSAEREGFPTPRDLAMTEAESQRDSGVLSPTDPKDLKKSIIVLCNIMYKVVLEEQERGCYNLQWDWLPKIFNILLSGTFPNFNRQITDPSPSPTNILPKELIFSKLFNLPALYSQQVHLNILLLKNLHSPQPLSPSSPIQISDQLLKTIKIEKKTINHKILSHHNLNLSTPLNRQQLTHLKQNLNPFLTIWKTNFLKVIDSFSVGDDALVEYETSLLNILGNYLKHTTSRIAGYEMVEQVFDILLFVKRQILELSLSFVQGSEKQVSEPSRSQANFSKKQLREEYTSPLMYSKPEFIGAFLSVIANITANNRFVQRLINNCFIRCQPFNQMLSLHCKHLFATKNYDLILKLLSYYRHMISMFNERYIKNKDTKPIRTIFKSIIPYLHPKTGHISTYLQLNENTIAGLLRTKSTLSKEESRSLVFFSELVRFCETVFGYPVGINPILEDDSIVSFYIRFSFMNFVRLYSFLTERELKALREQQGVGKADGNTNTHCNQMLLKRVLGLMKSLAAFRTEEMSRKFVHYKVLDFFIRELQLEYDIGQYPRRNRKRRQNTSNPNNTHTDTGFSLNLNLNFLSDQRPLKSHQQQKSSEKSIPSNKPSKTEGLPKKSPPIVPILPLPNQITKTQSDNMEDMPTKKAIPMLKITGLRSSESPSSSYKQDEGELGSIIAQINNKYECSGGSASGSKPGGKKVPVLAPLKLSKLESGGSLGGNTNHQHPINTEPKSSSDFSLSYLHERRMRKLYSSKTLHSQIVLLVFNLLIKKGLLDPVYCPQQAVNQDKMNVLLILHHHLNHPSNKYILPLLAQGVRSIQPYPSGQRLLKLLSFSFTNMNVYGQRNKLTSNGGSKCAIISCKTKLQEPKQVVIKQLSLSNDRYSCRLTNIFNEITCLDSFRLEPKITTLYDFGVTQYCYVIIMKKYKTSLRCWRKDQTASLKSLLPLLLKMFRQILHIVKLLHEQNVTHYDIKCDNVLLDYEHESEIQQNKFSIVFADFGCCKMYESDKDQFDLMHRGTEVAMSPEMLDIASKNKRSADDYDRRKRVGTTRASDIWSLGCLFFELMTGEYLFKNGVWGRVNRPVTDKTDILVKEDVEMLEGNIYLVDFLRSMLVRDPQMRPSINSVIARFEHIESMLGDEGKEPCFEYSSPTRVNETLEGLLDSYLGEFEKQKEKQKEKPKESSTLDPLHQPNRGLQKIMKDIYICDQSFAKTNPDKLTSQGITHIFTTQPIPKFNTTLIKPGKQSPISLALRLSPRLSDLLRQVIMFKGKLLFINNKQNFAISILLYTLSIWFKCSIYQTWCLINTQILEFPFSHEFLPKLSTAYTKFQRIDNFIQNLPKLQCVCCSVTMILPRPLPDIKHDSLTCKCSSPGNKKPGCPSGRCASYLEFLKTKFKIEWEQIIWRKVPQNCFLVGPFKMGQVKDSMRSQILINSADSNENLVEVGSSDAKEWRLYRCKVCEMWMMARNKGGDVMIVSNTHIKSFKQGIMIPNAQQGYKAKAPLLNQYTLSKLHLIEP